MSLRLHPLYKKLLTLAMVLGPIVWLVFTEDGRRRTDLVLLHLLGKGELNLAIEKLHSGMTEAPFRALFPDLGLTCVDGPNPFGDRLCTAEVGAFNGIPSRAFTLFFAGNELRAAKLNYRRAYHGVLTQQLRQRVNALVSPSREAPAPGDEIRSWAVSDGLLLLPLEPPQNDRDAALIWLSRAAAQERSRDAGIEP